LRAEVAGIATVQGAFGHVAAFGRAADFAVFWHQAAFWHHAALLFGGPQSGLMALATIALTGMLVALLAQGARIGAATTSVPLGCRAAALRAKSWRAGFLPQSDPDAPGRSRPRAPTASPAAV
jgi:hypothetical protein